jgi:hypothetical protein
MDEKRFRFDLFIALCALLVSTVAAGASAYQTYVINQQYQGSVWPYLGFTTSSNGKDALSLSLSNYGLGPALIRSFEITHDGKTFGSFGDIVSPIENAQPISTPDPHAKGSPSAVDITNVHPGSVIPAAQTLMLVRIQNSPIAKQIAAREGSFDVAVCYCSLLGRCWTRHLRGPSDQPQDVRFCPLPAERKTNAFGN